MARVWYYLFEIFVEKYRSFIFPVMFCNINECVSFDKNLAQVDERKRKPLCWSIKIRQFYEPLSFL